MRPATMPHGRDGRDEQRSGRTLVEMLVVLTLVGMMAAAAAPAFHTRFDERGAALVARTLGARLERARSTAARRATTVTLVLDPASGRTWQSDDDDAPLRADEPLSLRATDDAPVAIAASRARVQWTFMAAGGALGDQVLVRDRTRDIAVDVDPVTGAPRVAPR